jgi:membrane protein implicated in regulation of membrane protease activity
MWMGTLISWYWFGLAAALFALEAVRPGKFMLWLGLASILVGMIASVAPWPWPAEAAALVVFAIAAVPAWRLYERKDSPPTV